jgi:hypothetical protein
VSPGDSVRLIEWAKPPPVALPPTAVLVGFLVLSALLVAALWVVDAGAAEEDSSPTTAPAVGAGSGTPVEGETARPGRSDLDDAELRALVVARLRRFVQVADEPALEADAGRRCLACWAVFAAYRDCVALGLEAEARETLRTRPTSPAERPPDRTTPAVVPLDARLV